ncbi:MAG: DNA polymerase IV [Sarcina sp.]
MQEKRIILHIDVDAFFASVEIRDNSNLKGKPIVVGGSDRGVVTTASYEARKYGIKSAMPLFMAKSLCSNLITVPINKGKYIQASKEIFKIFFSYTTLVEKVSIDEAYIDISDLNIDPIKFALKLKKEIKEKVGLTVSAGISYNKFLAKLASEWNKPNGIMMIKEEDANSILKNLDISKINGLGNKSIEKLNLLGIYKVKDLHKLSKSYLNNILGKFGDDIFNQIRGIDNRPVIPIHDRKSFGKEVTFNDDVIDMKILLYQLEKFSYEIETYIKTNNILFKTITIKIKTNTFETYTKSKSYNEYIGCGVDILQLSKEIFSTISLNKPLRLIGLTISNLKENMKINEQLKLF